MQTDSLPKWMEQAIWDGNDRLLNERARCECCCDEHTFEGCPARQWGGCRGQFTPSRHDIESWAKHYGMTAEEFLR